MPTPYDSGVLQQFADDLYRQAKWIEYVTALRYGLLTFLFSTGVFAIVGGWPKHIALDNGALLGGLFVAVFGVLVGIYVGQRKSFELRLKAQGILCQVAIEQNTRQQEKSLAATQS